MYGAPSWLKEQYIQGYLNVLTAVSTNVTPQRSQWLPSIQNLAKIINKDPALRMNWEYGISHCSHTLPGKTGDDVLSLIDAACRTPPAYSRSDLVGFPINIIFVELMENENGRNLFSN